MRKCKPLYGEERKVLNQSALLYVSEYISIFFKFGSGFLIAKFLGPALYGLRTLFGLVLEYQYFSHLGTLSAMQREVPYFRGRKDEKGAEHIINNVFGVNFLYSLVACAILIFVALCLKQNNYERIYVDFVIFLSLYIVVNKIGDFYRTKLIVDKRAFLIGKVTVLYGCVNALACVTLVYYFGLRGLFLGLLIGSVVKVAFMVINVGQIPAIQLSGKVIWGLLKVGFPIMLTGLMFILFRSIDRVMIAAMLSKEMLGYFAIGTIVSGLIYSSISEIIRVIFFPRLMEKLGKTGDIRQIKEYLVEPTVLVAYFIPFLVGALFLGIHLPLKYFVPEYLPSINVTQILILGSFFFSVLSMPLLICIASNRQVKIVFLTFSAIVLNAVLSYSFIHWGWGIEGVAIGTAISYFALGSIIIWYALKQFKVEMEEYVRFFSLIYAPFLYAFCLFLLLDNLFSFDINGFWSDVFYTSIKIGFFFLMFSLIFIFVRKHDAFQKLKTNLPIIHRRVQTELR